jgi:nucleosome assembly protein 1-like 1
MSKKENEEENKELTKEDATLKKIGEFKDKNIQLRLLELHKLDLERDKVCEDKYDKANREIEIKYENIHAEKYKQINDIVCNVNKDITLTEEEKTLYGITEDTETDKDSPIEDYWYKVVLNSKFFDINDRDKDILKNLTKVEYLPSENTLDFTVKFYFKENEYFTTNELNKSYKFNDKDNVCLVIASDIDWKSEEVNPTIKKKKKKIKKGKKQITTTITKKCESFFNFFKNFDLDKKTDGNNENDDDDEEEEFEEEEDKIEEIMNEVEFFRNEFFDEQLEFYLNYIKFEDEDDDGEFFEEEDEDLKPKKKKGKIEGKKRKKSSSSRKKSKENNNEKESEKKEECKNQ